MNSKKELNIKGELIRPLMVGRPACIRELNSQRITTKVVKVIEHKDNSVVFETKNTLYRLELIGPFMMCHSDFTYVN